MASADEVLEFWLDRVGPKGWYLQDADLDAEIGQRFGDVMDRARAGGLSLWLTHPSGTLAYIVVTDQFPRNVHRGDGRAFATDGIALGAAKMAIRHRWDLRIDEPARQFFYLPLMHSELLPDQSRGVCLFLSRMPETGGSNLLHARAHREVIRRFGRFPYRNDALGRTSTAAERRFMEAGGYGEVVRAMEPAA